MNSISPCGTVAPAIEPLETHIAPAAVFTFTDLDGDVVKITTSSGRNVDLGAAATIVGGQLLDLRNSGFGRNTDIAIPGATLVSRIAIGGTVAGSKRPEDHFGFVAKQIGSFQADAFMPTLTLATDTPIEFSLFTGDVTVREI